MSRQYEAYEQIELVKAARRGHDAAFDELYRRLSPRVLRRLAALLGPRAPLNDLCQEVFIQAWQNLSHFSMKVPFEHWLLRIATNRARRYYRYHQSKWARLFSMNDDYPEMHRLDIETHYSQLKLLYGALDKLSTRLREAILLHELEGLTFDEIAMHLNISANTAASRVRRGRQKLKAILEQMGADFDFAHCHVREVCHEAL